MSTPRTTDGPSGTLPKNLSGKVAIVTGGSKGIGREISIQLALRGAHVVVNYSADSAAADATVQAIKEKGGAEAIVVQADVSKVEDVQRLFSNTLEKFGRLSILVNSAGCMDSKYAKVADISDEDLHKTVNINLLGTFYCLREAGKQMEDGGRIINISTSLVAFNNPGYGIAAYAGSKAAVETITRCMVHEMRGRGITVNCVAPGPVATDMFFRGKTEEMIERIGKLNPLERMGQPIDIAEVVTFLCGKEGEWVNGQILRANGGYI